MTSPDEPIACRLRGTDYHSRLAWIAQLAADGLESHHRDGLTLHLRYAPGVAARVRELVEQERACCAFLDFHLRETDTAIHLTITAPERAREVTDDLFGQFAPVGTRLAAIAGVCCGSASCRD